MSDKTESSSVESSGQGASSIDVETPSPDQGGETEIDGNREEISSEFALTELIERPEVALEDVSGDVPTCSGRGKNTAAVRGYNTERLASAVFDKWLIFDACRGDPWYDTFAKGSHDIAFRIESKSCVHRYPSGPYGRFRIWKQHHDEFVSTARSWHFETQFLYFFCVYTIEDEKEREVGKLVVPAERVDEVLDSWTARDHSTMGESYARDISWHQLLKRLGVPETIFEEQPIIDLTDGVPTED
jgi:hypothetical protein